MYIEEEFGINSSMKLVYTLREFLEKNPEEVAIINKLMLDESKPHMGLKSDKGLYNSDEWWANIENGVIPSEYRQGIITELYEAGMDHLGRPNSFRYRNTNSNILDESMYFFNKQDFYLFKPGHLVCIYYAQLECKNGEIMHDVIEMAVSTESVDSKRRVR